MKDLRPKMKDLRPKMKDLRPKMKGILESIVCRNLKFMWSLGPLP